MAERDKVIKSGQFTLPRILFLAVVGGIIVFTVYAGGVYLSLGYWFLTLSICALLFLIAMDYGVKLDKVEFGAQTEPAAAVSAPSSLATPEVRTTIGVPRPKRRTGRSPKRRR